MQLVVVLMIFLTAAYGSDLPYFMIKHRASEKCFWPYHIDDPSDPIQLFPCKHQNDMRWQFVPVVDHWGYIRHVDTDAVIHPQDGDNYPDYGTSIVIHKGRHWGALFALDAVNERVVHKGGYNVHPFDFGYFHIDNFRGKTNPSDGTGCILVSGTNDASRFLFVSPNDLETEVLVYGLPTMLGEWKMINSVISPLAVHKSIFTVKVGKSETQSITTTFEYTWESSAGFSIDIFTGSAGQSFTFKLELASSTTWYEEATRTREITMQPGDTVVTWQYVFTFAQGEDHKGVYQSNLLADTDSPSKEPDDMLYSI